MPYTVDKKIIVNYDLTNTDLLDSVSEADSYRYFKAGLISYDSDGCGKFTRLLSFSHLKKERKVWIGIQALLI